ncbi:hypothetical protein [Paraburkholderia xenovorans]|uniref:hypothetical protein n=1 Tax=Paraburkholderia xenovorans TaxID=36873 RepID=UPI0038B8A509
MREALPQLTRIARAVGMDLRGTTVSMNGGYDCRTKRYVNFNCGVIPNIDLNSRGAQNVEAKSQAIRQSLDL